MPDQNSPTGVPGFTATPLPTGTGTTQSPIGVPTGYKAPTQPGYGGPGEGPGGMADPGNTTGSATNPGTPTTDFGTTPNTTQYTAGQEWSIPLASPQTIPDLKAALLQAGLLTPKTFGNPGVWDAASASAYSKVLGFANAYGLNATQAINYFASNPVTHTTTQPVISFANPVDVQSGYQNASQSLTGQEQPTAGFEDYYHGLEASSQHLRGQDYTQAPSITGAATQYVQQHDPAQEMAYGVASRMAEFFSMLGSSA